VDNIIELETGAGIGFKIVYTVVNLLAVLVLLTAATAWINKFIALVALGLVTGISARHWHSQETTCKLRIYLNGSVSLIDSSGQEIPGVLEKGSWTSRWIAIVRVGRFDRWRTQHLLVCTELNSGTSYRQFLKWMRLGVENRARSGILGTK
jgi:hypothetical protein